MAGAGVTVGGAGMLRTRRRDVSIKPNRRLDRKSSRGMIYENEELRLRTIHINAEVEQGQNDIKKLRRENEQLRREIWSLRDEYEKLEVLIKTQSSHGSSDEIEGRSEEDENNDEVFTEYSGEEDVVEEDVEALAEDGESHEEHLDNAENQKISTEKMNNSNLHRLHVAFDDLSIVDEEEELKKEKEKKDSVSDENQKDSSDAKGSSETVAASEAAVVEPDKVNLDYFATSPQLYDHHHHHHHPPNPDLSSSEQTFFSDCPFVFPSPSDPNYPKMLPMDSTSGLFGCLSSGMYSSSSNRLESLPSLDTPGIGPVASAFGHSDHFFTRPVTTNQARELPNQIGAWQATTSGNHQMPGANLSIGTPTPRMSTTTTMPRGTTRPSGQMLWRDHSDITTTSNKSRLDTPVPDRVPRPTWRKPTAMYSTSNEQLAGASNRQQSQQDLLLSQMLDYRTNAFHKDPGVETVSQNGWDSARSPDKPKHFFAPLSTTLSTPRGFAEDNCSQNSQVTAAGRNNQDTGNSSSSEKTTSTVVSGHRPLQHPKGSADLYVAGGFPAEGDASQAKSIEQSTFLSFENFLVEEARTMSRQNSNNPLTKSLSCQDLSTDQQLLQFAEKLSLLNGDNGTQKLAKSDNTLDNISNSSRPYRSQLHVTLKQPRLMDDSSASYTPEIPKLPSINYRLFNNPFLQGLDQQRTECPNSSLECPTLSRPLSIQVDETRDVPFSNGYGCYTSPVIRGLPSAQRSALERDYWRMQAENDSRMLLMAANNKQFRNFEQDAPGSLRSQPIGFEMTSFEGPNPRTLRRPVAPFTCEPHQHPTLNLQGQRLYQNVQEARMTPVPFCGLLGPMGPVSRLPFDATGAASIKVPAQTQTSIDGDSQKEGLDEQPTKGEHQSSDVPGSPLSLRRRRTSRKERSGSVVDKRPLSPAAQRRRDRLRKQQDVGSVETPMDFSSKSRLRKFSMASSGVQDKIESRSSSSGQDSPKKIEQRRRVSLYFNAKKRPSIGSTSVVRRSSLDTVNDERYLCVNDAQDGTTTNSERERTNSVSSRDTVTKGRKLSTGSDTVPWCACWGNGCV